MASLPSLTILEQSQISPPPATVGNCSLPLTFFDINWLSFPPINNLFFYELPVTKTQFTETIVPNLKNSLSITLKHFFPFAGNLIIFSSPTSKPEICYVDGDFVAVTSAECNLDFNDLTGNHPRNCDKFYPLVPILKRTTKVSDFIAIPVFSIQVTIFPDCGYSIGTTNHHSLGDGSTLFNFFKAWTSIAKTGTDELFLAKGTLPIYDRLVKYPKLDDESYLRISKVATFGEEYQPPSLFGPADKVRGKFILTRVVIDQLKKLVSTQMPTVTYVSSFTVTCAYIWSCIAESRNDELEELCLFIDCRARMDPPIPMAYFGNCVKPCRNIAKTSLLTGKEGFMTAVKVLGDNLLKNLTSKDILLDNHMYPDEKPTTIIGVAGSPKLSFYNMDFGWGNPKSYEMISIDYNQSISMNSSKESNENLEISLSLSATEMKDFDHMFNHGLEAYI